MNDSRLMKNYHLARASVHSISWLVWVAGIHVFFTLTTMIAPYLPQAIRDAFFHHLDLSKENNVAVWWSAVNLFVLALLALRWAEKNRIGKLHYAWIVLSLFFAVLSIDEIGSLHERVSWEALFFPAAVMGLLLSGSLVILIRQKNTRRLVPSLVIGIVLLGLVALMDHLEDLIVFPAWSAGVRSGVEEGLELLGMFIILAALAGHGHYLQEPDKAALVALNPWNSSYLPAVLTAGLVVHAVFSFLAVNFSDLRERGNPAIWYPMAMSFLLFIAFLAVADRGPAFQRSAWLIVAGYFLLSSIAAVYIISPRQDISKLYSLGLFANFYFLYAAQLILSALIYRLVFRLYSKKVLFIYLFLALLLAFGFLLNNLALQFLAAGIFAFVMVYLFLLDGKRRMAGELHASQSFLNLPMERIHEW